MTAYYWVGQPEDEMARYLQGYADQWRCELIEGTGFWEGEVEDALMLVRGQGLPLNQLTRLVEIAGEYHQVEVLTAEHSKFGDSRLTTVWFPRETDGLKRGREVGGCFVSADGTLYTTLDIDTEGWDEMLGSASWSVIEQTYRTENTQ